MCNVCGCGSEQTHNHEHSEHKKHDDNAKQRLHFGGNEARVSVAGFNSSELVTIERNILDKNQSYANQNRSFFLDNKLFAVNLLSSPGAGKTSLLIKTIENLQQAIPIYVIEGDQETDNDAERIRRTGVEAAQINTGKGCHLDAHMVGHALEEFTFDPAGGLVLIENVGNLVCPAAFDLGESCKVVILSVTEGEDKPLKYPDMFAASDLMIISKSDLLPYLRFDVEQAIEYAKRVNPALEVIQLSVESGDGLQQWEKWLLSDANAQAPRSPQRQSVGSCCAHA